MGAPGLIAATKIKKMKRTEETLPVQNPALVQIFFYVYLQFYYSKTKKAKE